MPTRFVRYEIDPFKKAEFETYARNNVDSPAA